MKYTIRLNDRDDRDLIAFLKGQNVSRAFREALRSKIGIDAELESIVKQMVSRMLFDFLSGAGLVAGRSTGTCIPGDRHPSAPATKQDSVPQALNDVQGLKEPGQEEKSETVSPPATADSEEPESTQDPAAVQAQRERAMEMLRKCAFKMLGKDPDPQKPLPLGDSSS